jgi:hypothetical protein
MFTGAFMLQMTWLFPALSRQVIVIQAVNPISDSHSHSHKLYGTFEAAKLLILMVVRMINCCSELVWRLYRDNDRFLISKLIGVKLKSPGKIDYAS